MSEIITVQDFNYDWLEVGGRVGCRHLKEQRNVSRVLRTKEKRMKINEPE